MRGNCRDRITSVAGIQWFLVPGSTADTVRIASTRDGRRLRFYTGTYVGLAAATNAQLQTEWRCVADQHGWYFLLHPATNQRLRMSNGSLVTFTIHKVSHCIPLGLAATGLPPHCATRTPMQREYYKWYSPNLQREMELLVFGRSGGARVLVFPTRNGRFFEFEDRGMVNAIRDKLENGWLQLFCVDSVDQESLYGHSRPPRERIVRHLEYQNYILNEVIPFSEKRNPGTVLIAHGSSLGAYHATNLAFRFPHLFRKVVAFSGRYDLTHGVETFQDLFHGYYDDDVYFNNPSHYIANLEDESMLGQIRALELVFVIGVHDPFYENNLHFTRLLWSKNIWHAFREWHGRAHTWKYWREMAPLFL